MKAKLGQRVADWIETGGYLIVLLAVGLAVLLVGWFVIDHLFLGGDHCRNCR